ncbi:MAG: Mitochondrial GTPase [Paramarteilia canceri]
MFRSRFEFPRSLVPNLKFRQGHQAKGWRDIYRLINMGEIDCIIEVHDSRIPNSGRNSSIQELKSFVPIVTVFNKSDLVSNRDLLKFKALNQDPYSKFINLENQKGTTKTLKSLIETVQKAIKDYKKSEDLKMQMNLVVAGIPNVGKSTLINKFRNIFMRQKNALLTGKLPGVTKSLSTKIKICHSPQIFIYDTPGILHPSINNIDDRLKLCVSSTIDDKYIGPELVADYLLFLLNNSYKTQYVKKLRLGSPNDCIREVLESIAENNNKQIEDTNSARLEAFTSKFLAFKPESFSSKSEKNERMDLNIIKKKLKNIQNEMELISMINTFSNFSNEIPVISDILDENFDKYTHQSFLSTSSQAKNTKKGENSKRLISSYVRDSKVTLFHESKINSPILVSEKVTTDDKATQNCATEESRGYSCNPSGISNSKDTAFQMEQKVFFLTKL